MTKKTDETAPLLALAEEGRAALVVPAETASLILLQPEKFDQFYEGIKEQVSGIAHDLTTTTGRKAVASLAFRVTKTKTALDAAAKSLTEEWRQKTNAVNAARKPMIERLDKLAEEVRQPLTDWEQAEDDRIEANRAVLATIRAAATITPDDTAETVEQRGRDIWAMAFEAPQWSDDEKVEADAAKSATVAALVAARDRLKQEAADRAELERLRAEDAARREREEAERIERETREAAEAAERESRETAERQAREAAEREAREQEEAAERARQEAERIEQARQEAIEQARREAEEAAEATRQREAAEQAAALQAERDAREAAEREARALAEKAAREQAERDAAAAVERQRIADERAETARREKDRAHRGKIMGEVKTALMERCDLSEDVAKQVVRAIVAGEIPHAAVAF